VIRRSRRSPHRVAFEAAAARIEAAKDALLAGVPAPRREPVPLADALHAFERGIAEAAVLMDAWRTEETEGAWQACRAALDEAARGAERMRLDAPSLDFESLVLALGDLISPLEAFGEADRALRT